MATRTKGIFVESDGSRTINKIHRGERIYIRLGKVSQDEAEQRLKYEIESRSIASKRRSDHFPLFADCAAEYLRESKDKDSAEVIAWHIRMLLPFIGTLLISQVHDATLKPFTESRKEDGVSPTTINRSLEVVRTILNRAARAWRFDNGQPWLETAPPLITMLKESPKKPHPLSWEEQDVLLPELPPHLQSMALFGINSGARDDNVCGLRWDWEVPVPEVGRSVFLIRADDYKTDVEHVLVLNDAAWSIVEKQRLARAKRLAEAGIAEYVPYPERPSEFDFVFPYKGGRIETINNSAWQKARIRAAMKMFTNSGKAIPAELLKDGQRGILITKELRAFIEKVMPGLAGVRVHDLRHTYSSRLRLANVSQEDRNSLMGHKSASIPEHYASADIGRLIKLSNLVLDRQGTRTLLRVVNG